MKSKDEKHVYGQTYSILIGTDDKSIPATNAITAISIACSTILSQVCMHKAASAQNPTTNDTETKYIQIIFIIETREGTVDVNNNRLNCFKRYCFFN